MMTFSMPIRQSHSLRSVRSLALTIITLIALFHKAKGQFNEIPSFDFNGNDLGDASSSNQAETDCVSNQQCIGYNSNGWYKNDFQSAESQSSNFYVHNVGYGMQFVPVSGFDSTPNNDMAGGCSNSPSCTKAQCAYLCTKTTGCVGAIWDAASGNQCFLKSSFVTPSSNSAKTMLLPTGIGGCPISFITAQTCINPIPYNMIPSFDFNGNDIANAGNADAAFSDCQNDQTCMGFNSLGYYKKSLAAPYLSTTINFYVPVSTASAKFIGIQGWNNAGTQLGTGLTVASAYSCTQQCNTNTNCVGAVYNTGSSYCFLLKNFAQPTQVANYIMLLPLRSGSSCPTNTVTSVNNLCLSCQAGYVALASSAVCTPCSAGQSSNAGGSCFNCNAGQSSVAGGLCSNCLPGQFSAAGGLCTSCAPYQYQPNSGQSNCLSCTSCSSGQFVSSHCMSTQDSICSDCPIGQFNPQATTLSTTCSVCPSGYFSSQGSPSCTACGSNQNSFPGNPLPSRYHWTSFNGIQSSCECAPGYIGSNCEIKACADFLPEGSLMSLLINAVTEFDDLSTALASNPINQDYISNGESFLVDFLNNEVDFNGDNIIELQEVMYALQYRSVQANGLSNMHVWNCRHNSTGCSPTAVSKTRIYNEAVYCFLNSAKHLFDCSGVSIISSLKSTYPNSDDVSVCELSDQSWRPVTYQHPVTNWTYISSAHAQIGMNGSVCVYTNGINIKGPPFSTDSIASGIVSNFTDPNNNPNVTSYRRVYCVAVLLNNGLYSYECSSGLFYVSFDPLQHNILITSSIHTRFHF